MIPVAAPITSAVAAPKALTLVRLVLKSVSNPVEEEARVGFAPSTLTVVALGKVKVALLIVAMPVAAPITSAVAAPAKFILVAVPLIRLNVVAVVVASPPLIATSPVNVRVSVFDT